MNVRVYFDRRIERCTSFELGSGGKSAEVCGIKLTRTNDDRWYYELSGGERVHPKLVGLVDEISIHDNFFPPRGNARERGIYEHQSAQGEVHPRGAGQDTEIKAKRLEDGLELIHRIKAGSIRPTESYEGNQTGLSRAELEKRLGDAEMHLQWLRTHTRNLKALCAGKSWGFRKRVLAVAKEMQEIFRVMDMTGYGPRKA